MDKVFLVTHSYDDEVLCEQIKIIGVFSSEDDAKAAIEKLKSLEGFRDHPDGFWITPKKLGELSWEEGFFSA